MPNQMKKAKKTVRKKIFAALMLDGANGQKYGELKRGMAENYVMGTSEYPESPVVVLCILTAYKLPAGWKKHRQDAGAASKEEATFAQIEGNNWKANVICHNCKKKGHIAWECPNKNKAQVDEQIHASFKRKIWMRVTIFLFRRKREESLTRTTFYSTTRVLSTR